MTFKAVEDNMGDSSLEHISDPMTAIDGLIALEKSAYFCESLQEVLTTIR